jgi:hypothetical protein
LNQTVRVIVLETAGQTNYTIEARVARWCDSLRLNAARFMYCDVNGQNQLIAMRDPSSARALPPDLARYDDEIQRISDLSPSLGDTHPRRRKYQLRRNKIVQMWTNLTRSPDDLTEA